VGETGVTVMINKFSPILQQRGAGSLSFEIQEMWSSKKSTNAHPPAAIISPADLQKFLLQFTESYLCNLSSPCWTLKTTNKKFLGREMPTEGTKSTLFGTFGGVNAPELKVMNCETLVSIVKSTCSYLNSPLDEPLFDSSKKDLSIGQRLLTPGSVVGLDMGPAGEPRTLVFSIPISR
jgi:hypothetical protein